MPTLPSRPAAHPDHAEIDQTLRGFFVDDRGYPCIMARSVFELEQFEYGVYEALGADGGEALGCDLRAFLERPDPARGFRSFLAVFKTPEAPMPEAVFERRLWRVLEALHQIDREAGRPWDARVSSDPESPEFSFSFGGRAVYVVGMHPGASRPARRFRWPLIAFNLRSQFDMLRSQGRYEKVRDVIRARDKAFAGSVNPMVADFGQKSEAPQYAGRVVGDDWRCPFHPRP